MKKVVEYTGAVYTGMILEKKGGGRREEKRG